MATATKNKYAGTGSAGNNDGSRRAKTAKEGRCQWCHTKVPMEEQFVVFNDIENQKVVKAKNAAKPAHAKKSHYCGDCADKRKATKEKFDEAVNRGSGGKAKKAKPAKKASAKKVTKKATAKKAEAKPAKAAKKRKVVRRKKAAAGSAAKTSEPF